jgi:FHA domain
LSTIAIEINDAGVTVADSHGLLSVEPGYALLDRGRIVTGAEAARQARLLPRQVSNRYWAELSLEDAGVGDGRSHAELAFTQLGELWNRHKDAAQDAVLVVPGGYSKAQLGLLLGLAHECGITVRAMMDTAAAASTRPFPGRQLLYADASLHRVVVTPLRQDHEVTTLDEKGLGAAGLASLGDLFAKRIAEIFVLKTRFDPLHRADCEQALYDRLPDWLAQISGQGAAEMVLPFGAEEFRVEIERGQLLAVANGFYRALLQLIAQTREAGSGLIVQLSERLARQPGLIDELARLDDARVVAHPPGHAALAALAALETISTSPDQVKLLRHLPWRAPADESDLPEPAGAASPRSRIAHPTHVVYRGIAYPVDGQGILVGRAQNGERRMIVLDEQSSGISRSHCEIGLSNGELVVRDLSSYGTFVNEKRISGETVLHPADVIRVGSPGAELQLVRVET